MKAACDPQRTLASASMGSGSAESKLTHAVEYMVVVSRFGEVGGGLVEFMVHDTGIDRRTAGLEPF